MPDDGLYAALVRRGMTRRAFLQFSAAMAAALALPTGFAPQIAAAVERAERLPVIWLHGQACGGDTEAMLRSADPSTVSMFLDVLRVQYHESILAVAGADARLALTSAMDRYQNGYVAVVEGAVPDGASGAFCLIGGRPAGDVVREVCAGARATIAVGSCACDGGASAAAWNTTGARGVNGLVGDGAYLALPGCPVNPVNLASALVHVITFGRLPPADLRSRPLSAYGNLVHNQCERRPHFEFGEFATEWGDAGAQKGWCLYKLGCKGPETMANCPTVRYGEQTSWNVRSGAGCMGCTTTSFWNDMGPVYRRLPPPIFALPDVTADMLGGALLGGVAAAAAVHAVGMGVRFKRRAWIAARAAVEAGAAGIATAEARAPDTLQAAVADAPPAAPEAAEPTAGAPEAAPAAPEAAEPTAGAPEAAPAAPEAAPVVDPAAAPPTEER